MYMPGCHTFILPLFRYMLSSLSVISCLVTCHHGVAHHIYRPCDPCVWVYVCTVTVVIDYLTYAGPSLPEMKHNAFPPSLANWVYRDGWSGFD
ncbi:hypothetical protein BO85DRAFT_444554 [Aspergillus piperis CBS 112811]|uniref:Uncharacterized protein n=1 Tax=Aspergillus piperis CBS 112811 TaxID=1448313 RepID=A0A8G1RF35_9EURO|nr:hypothetical protein BO85DRAFT_444554 [Aspergillus piperis CBS 112811]RAH63255.1 hypothetical protein BO85DRAFT_444554 [Aspergillus piperis CBS 112811]